MGDLVGQTLDLLPTGDGLIVRVGDPPIPVEEWTARSDTPSGLGVLLRLRDDGSAFEQDEDELLVAWSGIASLTTDELRYLGLPDQAPFALEIVADGAIHDPDFEVHSGFVRDGRRVLGVERQGAWLRVAGNEFVLPEPLHSIVEAIEQFPGAGDADLEAKMLGWGRIAEQLPPGAVVDDQLGSLQIAVGSSFRLEPFVNESNEPDFDPVIGRRQARLSKTGEEETGFEAVLPPASQGAFARRFRGMSRVKHRYALGGNTYVVLTPEAEQALGVVRRAQAGSADDRRRFLKDASEYVRRELDDRGAETVEVDEVFSDEGLSDRVKGVGIWTSKVLPWITQAKDPWLPPPECGLRVDGRDLSIPPEELTEARRRLQEAIERGDSFVQIAGEDVPANSDTRTAIEDLIGQIKPPEEPTPTLCTSPAQPEGSGPDTVLLVIDNLETIEFRREQRHRGGAAISETDPDLGTKLLDHQKDGLRWLKEHWDQGSGGALLADDMGLGKTLEALAFLSCLKKRAGDSRKPMLVVAPTGLIKNWRDEHDKHLPDPGLGRAVEAHGRELRDLRRGASGSGARGTELTLGGTPVLDLEAIRRADWVLTTYETLRDYQHSFGRIPWSVGVFDEAQKIKNPAARLTEAALAMNIDFVVLMTGTPVENRPADIWSLLDRIEPGRFPPLKEFSAIYDRDGTDQDQTLATLHKELTHPKSAGGPPLMLRRLKEDHLPELPEKKVHRRLVAMPPRQAEAYEKVLLNRRRRRGILHTLQRLRNISLHPVPPAQSADLDTYIQESARLCETFRILEDIAARQEKALIFVELLEMQAFLVEALRRRFPLSQDVLVINGAVAGGTRQTRVAAFQKRRGFDAMILSPRAGGVGLTLTAANHVIHLSRWWNPAVEDQCTDRVFRIGQHKTVHVYLPMAQHPRFGDFSFDVRLDALLRKKREMNRRVLAPSTATEGDVSQLFDETTEHALEFAQGAPDGAEQAI